MEAVQKFTTQREADKLARTAARDARKTALKSCTVQDGPFFMFGRQMWPIPEGSPARYYSFDQLLFGSLFFHSWWNILHHRSTDRRSLAITMRTNLKFLRMMVDRRLPDRSDEKSEMTGFVRVFEILCDAYERNTEGDFDLLHDLCIKHDL